MGFNGIYPLVIKHGSGKSTPNGGFNRKITELNGPFFQQAMFDSRRVTIQCDSQWKMMGRITNNIREMALPKDRASILVSSA